MPVISKLKKKQNDLSLGSEVNDGVRNRAIRTVNLYETLVNIIVGIVYKARKSCVTGWEKQGKWGEGDWEFGTY